MSSLLTLFLILYYFSKKIEREKERYRKLYSQKKSGEVVMGAIAEAMAPMLDNFPVKGEEKELHFLGMPIDYIHFGEDEIKFIEVKSGKSTLSTKQRNIKKQIESGKVSFVTVRIPEKSVDKG